ncbi:hypothetical protein CL616_04500 [archaeon]|jgi:cyclopropane fatty-acyl-phospholipid synthase-like methyltransferase|nr:hypothetical protein [archaeon]|tara:strand:+ start:641 stop:1246 length:606 start_codon:yes stop_codon:yes gene_type:complete
MTEEKYFFEKEVFSKPNYKFSFELEEELLDDILKLKKSGKVLELGCGEAGTSLALAEKGFDVTCIDISETAIKNIKKEAKKKGIKINAFVEDLETFEIKEKYDIIIGTGIFHFLPKELTFRLLEDVKEHTVKKGLNIFEVFLEGDPSQEEDSEGYYFKKTELKNLYSKWNILDYEEHDDYDEEEEQTNKLAFLMAENNKKR